APFEVFPEYVINARTLEASARDCSRFQHDSCEAAGTKRPATRTRQGGWGLTGKRTRRLTTRGVGPFVGARLDRSWPKTACSPKARTVSRSSSMSVSLRQHALELRGTKARPGGPGFGGLSVDSVQLSPRAAADPRFVAQVQSLRTHVAIGPRSQRAACGVRGSPRATKRRSVVGDEAGAVASRGGTKNGLGCGVLRRWSCLFDRPTHVTERPGVLSRGRSNCGNGGTSMATLGGC